MGGKKYIFLFPGQGAQYPGMALDFLEGSPGGEVRRLFDTASEICGGDMAALIGNADGETLKRTGVSQPAITLANLAAAACLADRGIRPAGCAGFSLGEYAALVTAGVLDPADCFRLVKVRGEVMQAAADRIAGEAAGETTGMARQPGMVAGIGDPPDVTEQPDTARLPGMAAGIGDPPDVSQAPGMAAVIGLAPERAEALIAEWAAGGLSGLYPANINSPRQLVVSGTAAALTEAERRFREAGARRFIRLRVAGPFHSPLVAEAAEKFRPALEAAAFRDPRIPLYSNVTGRRIGTGDEARSLALRQITSPVRWVEEEETINADGFDAALEAGPGRVLQGLWRDSGSAIPCYAAGTVEDIRILSDLLDRQ
jgi:[acyl-carrier-protein] S-malonyltransferase